MRQDRVGRNALRQQFRVDVVKREEAAADKEERQPGRYAHHGAEQSRLARLARAPGGEIALDHVLVARVFGSEIDESEYDHDCERTLAEAGFERAEAEFVELRTDAEHIREPLRQPQDDERHAEQSAEQQHDGLGHIGPDHGFDTAERRVEYDDDPPGEDDPADADTEHFSQRNRYEIEHGRQPELLQQYKAEGGVEADCPAVSFLKVLECADRRTLPEERDDDPCREQRDGRQRQVRHELPVVEHESRRRQREKGD